MQKFVQKLPKITLFYVDWETFGVTPLLSKQPHVQHLMSSYKFNQNVTKETITSKLKTTVIFLFTYFYILLDY
jgi:hypothetical protein